ncbi:hypothetical protein BRC81_02880 [Halobacteriales archaeon QS_1_68_20]|nr:MAG: hypothetical protein BRC81_02880 [Halobacteriales archaeon QS_1_68_20]
MIAGTLALLESPAEDPLETWSNDGSPPALDVRDTQQNLDGGSVVQHGVAAGRVTRTRVDVDVAPNGTILTTSDEVPQEVTSEWVADVTGSGLVVAESVYGSGEFAFPFDVIASQTNERPEQLAIDVESLGRSWEADEEDGLLDTWMVGRDDGEGARISYHQDAHPTDAREATIGLGFERDWRGTVARGVVYRSGYVAIWRDWTHAVFCRFVEQELLPFAFVPEDDEEAEQTTLDESGGDA